MIGVQNEELEVVNDLLGFQGMKIIQRKDMLNFSLDSILLANFVNIPKKTKNILDLGTGNAPIPLFLSTKTAAKIYGIEIQKDAVSLAQKNIKLNQLEQQIEIIEHDVRELDKIFSSQSVDIVVSNPPFFKITSEKQVNDNIFLKIARHEYLLTLEQLIEKTSFVLENGGYFAMVHRPDRFFEIIELLKKYRLEPKRIQFIHPKEQTDANMLLIEARKNGGQGAKILPPIIAHDANGNYTTQVLKMFEKIGE